MTKTWNTRLLLVSVLLLMLVVVTPVAATTITVELNKTYEFKNTHLSTIKTLDLGDPSVSKVEIQTTAGDNSDVRVLQQPNVLKITRIFTTPNGTFMGNNVIIEGDQISTIDYTSRPDYRYYINYTVPTFKVTVPGYTGNPMAVRYNDSWAKQDASLFRVANALYLYNGSGIGYTIGDNHYYSSGTFDNAPVDTNDLNYTLYNNRVSLNPYQADAHTDWLLGDAPPYPLAVTGKYYAGALIQDESEQTATIYALSPFVALKQETPISWTDDYGTHSLPMTYVKGEMGNVTLKFANTDPTLTKIGYAFVNSNAQYNMVVKVDTAQLAEKTNEQWQSLTPSDHIIEILYNGILNDFGSPFTYNMTAVGQANAPEATSYSQIAITPGYGMSGNATANQIFIPAESFSTLKDGVYYVYLMGINDDKNIVALSQSTVSIKSGTVPDAKPTTITSVSPISGYRNTTVAFTVNGANYPADLGTSGVNVTLTMTGQPTLVVNVTSVSNNKITGTFQTNKSVNGKWDVVLYTNDAGTTISPGAFTIKDSPPPVISSIVNPSSATGYLDSTVNFTLKGTGFEPNSIMGDQLTFVNLTDKYHPNDGITPTMLFVNETVIIGYVNIPNTVNATNTTARYLVTWQFNVSTRDSGVLATKDFTIKSNAKPIIQTIRTPSTGIFYLNTTPNFTLIGQNFQADSATGQKMTFLNVTNNVPPYNVTTTILAVNSTTIIGYVNISSDLPVSATGHLWVFNVSTKDGGLNTVGSTQKTITVSQRPAPTLASLNVTSANRNNTIPLKLTGTNFYPADGVRDGFTNVSLVHNFNGNTLYLAISSISADGKTIDGTITLPRDATSGVYDAVVTTVDGGTATKESAFTINYLPAPSNLKINLTTVYKNTNVPFEVTGNNFQTTENGTIVTFQNVYIGLKLNTTLTSVTPTKITGNFTIPADVSTSTLDLVVTTIDGGTTVKTSAFNVNYLPLPTLAAAPLNVTSAYKNSTVTFILLGNYFQPDNTYVRLYLNSSVTPVYAVLTSVTPTRITGSFTIPYDQPSGKYRLDLFTTSGGSVSKLSYFTISPAPRPTISGISPTTIYQNNTFLMTVNGDNFQTGSGTNVSLSYGTNQYFMTLNSVTKKQLNGTFTIPLTATAATGYKLNVTTLDGGGMATPYSFTVMQNPKAVVTAISAGTSTNPAYRNTTVAFTVTGKYFQTQDGAMNVTFWNRTQNQPFNATLYSVTTTQIIGSVFIPSDAPLNTWYVNASSADGKSTVPATTTFIVSPMPKPTFASIIPNSGTAGTTVSYTLNGNNFLPRKGTTVFIENGTTSMQVTVNTIYQTRIIGAITIPSGAPAKKYWVNISTADAGWTNTTDKFSVI